MDQPGSAGQPSAAVRARSAAPTSPASGPSAACSTRANGRKPRPVRVCANSSRAGPQQQLPRGRHAPADDEHGRVEHRGQVGQPAAEPAPHRRCRSTARPGRPSAAAVSPPGRSSPRPTRRARACGRPPPATRRPARGRRGPARVRRRTSPSSRGCRRRTAVRPGTSVMCPYSQAIPYAPRYTEPSMTSPPPMPVPSVTHDDDRLALRGAEAVLGPRGGVRVVLDDQRQRDAACQRGAQRLVAPGEVRREQHGGVVVRDPAGGTDADRDHVVLGGAARRRRRDDRLDLLRRRTPACPAARGRAPGPARPRLRPRPSSRRCRLRSTNSFVRIARGRCAAPAAAGADRRAADPAVAGSPARRCRRARGTPTTSAVPASATRSVTSGRSPRSTRDELAQWAPLALDGRVPVGRGREGPAVPTPARHRSGASPRRRAASGARRARSRPLAPLTRRPQIRIGTKPHAQPSVRRSSR